MRTIAMYIDEDTLSLIDRLSKGAAASRVRPGAARGPARPARSRSEIVREALREYVSRREKLEREARDRQIYARNRALVARQASALVEEQAEP